MFPVSLLPMSPVHTDIRVRLTAEGYPVRLVAIRAIRAIRASKAESAKRRREHRSHARQSGAPHLQKPSSGTVGTCW